MEAGGDRHQRAAEDCRLLGLGDAKLVAKLDELTDEMRHQWWIHGHINFVLLSSSAFCDLYDKVVQPSDRPSRTRPCRPSTPTWSMRRAACGRSAAWSRAPASGPAIRHDRSS